MKITLLLPLIALFSVSSFAQKSQQDLKEEFRARRKVGRDAYKREEVKNQRNVIKELLGPDLSDQVSQFDASLNEALEAAISEDREVKFESIMAEISGGLVCEFNSNRCYDACSREYQLVCLDSAGKTKIYREDMLMSPVADLFDY